MVPKGIQRFNGYLKNSFITPLSASLKQAGLELDVSVANAQVGPWLQDVAHQRLHGTTGEKPQVLLEKERHVFYALPLSTSQATDSRTPRSSQAIPVESFQHPLSTYDQLLEVRA